MSIQTHKARQSFTVPATDGNYAPERITFGDVAAGVVPGSLLGVSIVVESDATGAAVVELWLPKIGAVRSGGLPVDADYSYSGLAIRGGTDAPLLTVPLASYPGAQIRVKAGTGAGAGACVVNATAN